MPRFKLKFSWEPYLKKKEEQRRIKQNRLQFEKEQKERRKWIIKKSFNPDPYLNNWDRRKNKQQGFFSDLAIQILSMHDAVGSANEILEQGLGLRETSIDTESIEDLAYNISMVKIAEFIASKSLALNKENQTYVMTKIIDQLFPPPVPQKPPATPSRGEKLLEELIAIKSLRQE